MLTTRRQMNKLADTLFFMWEKADDENLYPLEAVILYLKHGDLTIVRAIFNWRFLRTLRRFPDIKALIEKELLDGQPATRRKKQ